MSVKINSKKIKKEMEDIIEKALKEKVKKALGHSKFKLTKKIGKITIEGITEEEQKKINMALKR